MAAMAVEAQKSSVLQVLFSLGFHITFTQRYTEVLKKKTFYNHVSTLKVFLAGISLFGAI